MTEEPDWWAVLKPKTDKIGKSVAVRRMRDPEKEVKPNE